MISKGLLLWLIWCSTLLGVQAYWGDNFVARFEADVEPHECPAPSVSTGMQGSKNGSSREPCDENQLMLQLARLYIITPERIVLLLTTESSPEETCKEIFEVLRHMNSTLHTCVPLAPDDLYMKLRDGLQYYYEFMCNVDERSKKKHITRYHDCMKELREDLIDCEGPADWFEKTNKSIVCPFYNDIINCNYIKAAMLCGLTPAVMLRTFSTEVMKRVVVHDCKVSRSLPHVEDPMPATGSKLRGILLSSSLFLFLLVLCFVLFLSCPLINIDS